MKFFHQTGKNSSKELTSDQPLNGNERMNNMRSSDKSEQVNNNANEVFGVNFHDFLEKQSNSTMYELASEFGISIGDVKKLKKHINRY